MIIAVVSLPGAIVELSDGVPGTTKVECALNFELSKSLKSIAVSSTSPAKESPLITRGRLIIVLSFGSLLVV